MNPSIVITLIDPDCSYSLPARWGNDYQIDRIEKVYLNGQQGLCLHLSSLQDEKIDTFIPGCQQIDCTTEYPYFYLLCLPNEIPPAIGSAWGNLYRISECCQVLRKSYFSKEKDCLRWHWRLTLSMRREPIKLLSPVQ